MNRQPYTILYAVIAIVLLLPLITAAQDSLDVSLLGSISFWDKPHAAVKDGDFLYVAVADAGLHILNVSDPADPVEVGYSDETETAYDVAVADGYAYYVGDTYLNVVDVIDPAQPYQVSSLLLNNVARCIEVRNGYAYIAGYQNFWVVDISQPLTLEAVDNDTIGGDAYDLAIAGNYVYVQTESSGLRIFDVTNPEAAFEAGSYSGINSAYGIETADSKAYIASADGLYILSLIIPTQPAPIFLYQAAMEFHDVALAGDFAYLAAGGDGMRIIDVSVPQSAHEAGSYAYGDCYFWRLTVDGDFAYVSDYYSGMQIIDVSTTGYPQPSGKFSTLSRCIDAAVDGDYAYLANADSGLVIAYIADSNHPEITAHAGVDSIAYGVAAAGNYAYVTAAGSGLHTFDVSDYRDPILTDQSGSPTSMTGCELSGGYLYVCAGSDGFFVYDLSDPAYPDSIAYLTVPGFLERLDIYGDYAYIAAGNGGLRVVNISDPYNPSEEGSIATSNWAYDVAVSGDYAYVADGWGGLKVIDVSTPSSPADSGNYALGKARGLDIFGDYLFVACENTGITALDISVPETLSIAGSAATPGEARNVIAGDGILYVADTFYFEVFDYSPALGIAGDNKQNIPASFVLYPVYPNPFNPTATIHFDLPKAGWVTLDVFDIQGRNVGAHGMRPSGFGAPNEQGARRAPLYDGWLDAGTHEIIFDGSHLSSGIYIYRLTAGDYSAAQKMVLLK